MNRIACFAPVSRPEARHLILGSMPGVASLTAGQYYAHPRNAFWPLMADILGLDAALPYEKRLAGLLSARIALWDVLAGCARQGSLDSAISGEEPNDFQAFFTAHPALTHVFFNGQKACQVFQRQVRPFLTARGIVYTTLPSTSPANASWSYAQKRAAWQAVAVK